MSRIWAITRNTIAQAIRNRVAFVIMGVYLLLVPALPFLVEGDGTLEGLLHVVITYLLISAGLLLNILTIAVATTTLWSEFREKQIFIIESKPMRRWQLLVGKLLGIVAVDAALLVFMAIASLACVGIIVGQGQWETQDRERARRQVLAARRVLEPLPLVSDQHVKEQYDALRESSQVPSDQSEVEIKKQIRDRLTALANVLPPRGQRTWRFENVRTFRGAPALEKGRAAEAGPSSLTDEGKAWGPDQWRNMTIAITAGMGRGQVRSVAGNTSNRLLIHGAWDPPLDATSRYRVQSPPTVRFKFYRSDGATSDPVRCAWAFGVPGTKTFHRTPVTGYKAAEFGEIAVPIDTVREDGALDVYLFNAERDEAALVFSGPDALQLLIPVSGFVPNLARGLALLLVQLVFLAVLGLFFSTYINFPLAPIAALCVLLVIHMTAVVSSDLERGYLFDRGPQSKAHRAYEYILSGMVGGLSVVLPRFDTCTDRVSSGLEVPRALLLRKLAGTGLLRAGVLMLCGAWIFHHRELALHAR